ncbi:MAG: hypothetical protein ACTHMO_10015 [Rhodanobacteraceae bacterium]
MRCRAARCVRLIAFVFTAALAAPLACAAPKQTTSTPDTASFTLQQVLDYPFPPGLAAAEHGGRVAWVINLRGVRNVWVA